MEDHAPQRSGPTGALNDGGRRILTHVIYGLQAVFIINGVTLLLAVVLNYMKQAEMRGTLYESHFRHQIRTFWVGLGGLLAVLAMGALIVLPRIWRGLGAGPAIGVVEAVLLGGISVALIIYLYYRIVNGWLALLEERPIG